MKAECLQLTGSFKVRGAFNKMSGLGKAELEAGMVAASAGNHAQAVALAAERRAATPTCSCRPSRPSRRSPRFAGYGGEVHLVNGSYEEAADAAREFAEAEHGTLIPPFDDAAIVAGQGTVGLEIARQAPTTRLVVVPLGGGGLASGRRDGDQGEASGRPGCRRAGRGVLPVRGFADPPPPDRRAVREHDLRRHRGKEARAS